MVTLWVACCLLASLQLLNAELISHWELKSLPDSTNELNGSIIGYYHDRDRSSSSSSSSHSSSSSEDNADKSIWIVNPQSVSTGAVIEFSLHTEQFSIHEQSPSQEDLHNDYLKYVEQNSFVTIGEMIYFVDYHPYNSHDCGGPGGDASDGTLLSNSCRAYIRCFSMKTGAFIHDDDHHESCNMDLHEATSIGYYNTPPCLAQKDGKYLMVFGGEYYDQDDTLQVSSHHSNKFFFYEFKYDRWTQGPKLPHGISNMGCIVATDEYLYAIGGVYNGEPNTDIERIHVDNMSRIHNTAWTPLDTDDSDNYVTIYDNSPQNPVIAEVDSVIYVIGGGNDASNDKCSNVVFYIDISEEFVGDGVIDVDHTQSLQYDTCGASGVAANGDIYVFGGYYYDYQEHKYKFENNWQKSSFVQESTTGTPTSRPTNAPVTVEPTKSPTDQTTLAPTDEPTTEPTDKPTAAPTDEPTAEPTLAPSDEPTKAPTSEPTGEPTKSPTNKPTVSPTDEPTVEPTEEPTNAPTDEPTAEPTNVPTDKPTVSPTDKPTNAPTDEPTGEPTKAPTVVTDKPTGAPSTVEPTKQPTQTPTVVIATTENGISSTHTVPQPNLKSGESSQTDWIVLGSSLSLIVVMIAVGGVVIYKRHLKARANSNEDMLRQEIAA